MKRALFIILWLVLLGGLAQAIMALTPPAPGMIAVETGPIYWQTAVGQKLVCEELVP